MNILLTNDDGIKAEGIRVLAQHLKAAGHNLLVIAPSRERSATSHAATFGRPLYLEQYCGMEGIRAFSLSGKPADCVKFGAGYFTDFQAELIISGINLGQNIGTDIIYSGTVSAAQEGALLGINSVAVSSGLYQNYKHANFETAARFITDNIQFFVRHECRDTYFNVNVPGMPRKEIKGVKIVKHGFNKYDDRYEIHTDSRGKEYFVLTGGWANADKDIEDCDVGYFKKGYITITPLFYSRTNKEKIKEMESEELR